MKLSEVKTEEHARAFLLQRIELGQAMSLVQQLRDSDQLAAAVLMMSDAKGVTKGS